jgi:alpha-methylacyl-CoA racemase
MGPLAGVRIIELAGVGPAPFCAMLLSDMGAEVIRVDRVESAELGVPIEPRLDLTRRGRRSAAVDLKTADGIAVVKRLVQRADALIEGFRPGVLERLGLGPEVCLALNRRLVYGRVTGWGREGPLAHAAGHDINYIALAGVLGAIGEQGGPPVPPLNLVGDYGGGGLYLAFGIVCALLEAQTSGLGQIVDAAMVDCAASLLTSAYAQIAAGTWQTARGSNMLDGGAPWYGAYETADGGFVCVGAIEPRFYAELLRRIGIGDESLPAQYDRAGWPLLRKRFADVFKTRTRDEWAAILESTDACFAPVLSLLEAPRHPHNVARKTFVEVEGVLQPGPAPRFSRTMAEVRRGSSAPGQDTDAVLAEWGFAPDELSGLRKAGVIH